MNKTVQSEDSGGKNQIVNNEKQKAELLIFIR